MEKTKVVTFRIEESVLADVDRICQKVGWYKRSHVIAAGLRLMVELDKKNLARRVMSFSPRFDDVVNLEFEIKRKQVR